MRKVKKFAVARTYCVHGLYKPISIIMFVKQTRFSEDSQCPELCQSVVRWEDQLSSCKFSNGFPLFPKENGSPLFLSW